MRLTSSGATAWRHLSGFWLVVISWVMLAKHIFGVSCFVLLYSYLLLFLLFKFYFFFQYFLVLCDLSVCSEAGLVNLHSTIDLKKVCNLFIFTTFTFESLKNFEDDAHLQLFSLSLCLNSTILSSRTLFGFTFSFDFPESRHLILNSFCQVPGVGDKLTNRHYWMRRLNPWEVTGLPTLYTAFSIVLGRKGSALKFSKPEVFCFLL